MKVWDRAGIKLATSGSAVRLASVARHVTECQTVWIQIRPNVSSDLICVQAVCKGQQKRTLVGQELTFFLHAGKIFMIFFIINISIKFFQD